MTNPSTQLVVPRLTRNILEELEIGMIQVVDDSPLDIVVEVLIVNRPPDTKLTTDNLADDGDGPSTRLLLPLTSQLAENAPYLVPCRHLLLPLHAASVNGRAERPTWTWPKHPPTTDTRYLLSLEPARDSAREAKLQ